ncbi:MAG: hypothetical protein QOG80_347 [Pseudonocardiales bacterium]|nr:hypothetical protein [Pseudonocardiales bacterium]
MFTIDRDAEVAEFGHPLEQRRGDQALLRIEFVRDGQDLVAGEGPHLGEQGGAARGVPWRGQLGQRRRLEVGHSPDASGIKGYGRSR